MVKNVWFRKKLSSYTYVVKLSLLINVNSQQNNKAMMHAKINNNKYECNYEVLFSLVYIIIIVFWIKMFIKHVEAFDHLLFDV